MPVLYKYPHHKGVMDRKKKIQKILIANRGEVAHRINSTCKALSIETISIYTEEDQFLPYIFDTNSSYKLPTSGAYGYLDQEAIIKIAQQSGADALHPGYGFLSENGDFAQKVLDAGLIWIGPSPRSINLLGDKSEAQNLAKAAQIPTVPAKNFDATLESALGQAKIFAREIGFPILLKCAHGGGGKGMRCVKNVEEFESAWAHVYSEAKKQFCSSSIIVEKKINKPRHVEVQIVSDGAHCIHLFERECSIQRRHQKIIEESPCNFVQRETKEKLYQAAIKIAQLVNYHNIGTVEFLVDEQENFYFLEMNPRLQVEHSVTEFITATDLVETQIKIASGYRIEGNQNKIKQLGHAIECRIYAEDPQENFSPSTGTIKNLILPNNPFLRIDHALEEGVEITPYFDPMLMKFTTYGPSRKTASKHMAASLQNTNIFGITTNLSFLKNIIQSNEFASGAIHTQLLELNKNFQANTTQQSSFEKSDAITKTMKKKMANKPHENTKNKSLWRRSSWK